MELSKKNMEMEKQLREKQGEQIMDEEEMLRKVMEQSKQEAEEQEKMFQKNDELLTLMKQIEDDKPENWGLKKINVEDANGADAMEVYAHNMQKALKKLELRDKINDLKAQKQQVDVEKLEKESE